MLGRLAPSTIKSILTHPSADKNDNYERFFDTTEQRKEVYLEVATSMVRELKPDATESFIDVSWALSSFSPESFRNHTDRAPFYFTDHSSGPHDGTLSLEPR